MAHCVAIMIDDDSAIGAHYQNILGGRHGRPAALVFAVRVRGCPYVSLTNFNLSKKKKKGEERNSFVLLFFWIYVASSD